MREGPTPSAPGHKEKVFTGELLDSSETRVCRQCVGGLLYYTQDRADAQYEVSILVIDAWEANSRLNDCSETRDSVLEGNERLCQQARVGQ